MRSLGVYIFNKLSRAAAALEKHLENHWHRMQGGPRKPFIAVVLGGDLSDAKEPVM